MRTSSRKRPMSCLRPTSWRHCKTSLSPSSISGRTVLPAWNGEAERKTRCLDRRARHGPVVRGHESSRHEDGDSTVKHHDRFVLWQSRYTKHGIMSTGFRDGKGDILKDLSESCRKYGLKLGVYLSPADLYHIENPAVVRNLSPYTKRTIRGKSPDGLLPTRPVSNS